MLHVAFGVPDVFPARLYTDLRCARVYQETVHLTKLGDSTVLTKLREGTPADQESLYSALTGALIVLTMFRNGVFALCIGVGIEDDLPDAP